MITKAERAELRSIVRHQFKVLRAEVEQRELELIADLDGQIQTRFADEDQAWGVASHKANEALLEANRIVNDVYRELLGDSHVERMYVGARTPEQPKGHRVLLRREGVERIRAQVAAAILRLDRQEADLLRTLSVGALESEEVHAFLTSIPSVGDLVSTARLAELEAELKDVPHDERGWPT